MNNSKTTSPKIYVACLAAYNNGKLHGKWIDANQDVDSIYQEIREMLLNSPEPNIDALCCDDCLNITHYPKDGICPNCGSNKTKIHPTAEEWALHDYEGFEGFSLSEYESIENVVEYARLIEEYGAAYVAYANHVGIDYATKEGFEEAYQGEWSSEDDFAENLAEEVMDIPARLIAFFDYEKFSKEIFMCDYYSVETADGGVYVFLYT